jgi:hypothetical protein
MKKRLFLWRVLFFAVLVLEMPSLAGAAISISVNGDTNVSDEITMGISDTITLGIYNQGGGSRNFLSYLTFYYPSEGGYALGNERLGPVAGDFPNGSANWKGPYLYEDYEEIEFTQAWYPDTITPPGGPTGDMFLVDLHTTGLTDIHIELYDGRVSYYSSPVDTLIIHEINHEVPEPTTLFLLTLGGLFLRKRKA